ncbi:MAG: SPOR domain-containing protein [Alphaproteobacteria bacterium]
MLNNKTLLLAFCAATILTGCQKERVNPLLSKEKWEVTDWMYNNLTPEIEACSEYWEAPNDAFVNELESCEDEAEELADKMNYQGFSQHVVATDLNLPLYWKYVNERVQIRDKSKEDAQQHQERAQKNLGGFLNKLQND